MMSPDRLSIKGTSQGLIITVGSGDWTLILQEMVGQLSQKASFFKGGRVALQVGDRLLDTQQIKAVGDLLSQQDMTLWSVAGTASETQEAAQALGLEAELEAIASVRAAQQSTLDMDTLVSTTTTIRRTLRSGQFVEHPGNVVVIGDVNPGAKITAGGHIIVWGHLRGTVQAGALNPDDAFVCALELAPMQLIIGNVISRSPAEGEVRSSIPEIAYVQNGRIIAEAWR